MDESDAEAREPALVSALVAEHFALQSVASTMIGETGSRAAISLSV